MSAIMSSENPVCNVGLLDIEKAFDRISNFIEYTPVVTCSSFDNTYERNFHFKLENLQNTGSFKARGALNAVLCAKERDPNLQGVITHSSGNHGQALSWAASEVGVECCVVLPKDTPKSQIDAIKGYGAEIVMCEPTQQSREETCKEHAKCLNYRYISASDDYDVIAGQGTIALELLQQVKSLDAILVNGYEGGMAAGICLYAKAVKPDIKVHLVEPESNVLEKCLKEGKRKNPTKYMETKADSLCLQHLGDKTWPILLQLAEKQVFTVDNEEIIEGMKYVFQRMKFVIDKAAGATVSAAMSQRFQNLDPNIKNIGVIICGGNADIDNLPWL